jgi:hypothetical protein
MRFVTDKNMNVIGCSVDRDQFVFVITDYAGDVFIEFIRIPSANYTLKLGYSIDLGAAYIAG